MNEKTKEPVIGKRGAKDTHKRKQLTFLCTTDDKKRIRKACEKIFGESSGMASRYIRMAVMERLSRDETPV